MPKSRAQLIFQAGLEILIPIKFNLILPKGLVAELCIPKQIQHFWAKQDTMIFMFLATVFQPKRA
jgi:hypothetical protein